MGILRTTCAALILAPATAGAQTAADFADCAGRYSATVEHLWVFDGPASETAAMRRDAFADLVAALPGAPDAMARRVAARAAQRDLLDRAAFRADARAARLARQWIARCEALLPGS